MLINILHSVQGAKFRCHHHSATHVGSADILPNLVLIRGLPGSGKSTLANALATEGFVHLEADQFFMVDGTYQFVGERVRDAHAWCQAKARKALIAGARVVVANTFTTIDELSPYLCMHQSPLIVEARGSWPNIHGVPQQTLARMANRWESLPNGWCVVQTEEALVL
jgi:hypothetical protein